MQSSGSSKAQQLISSNMPIQQYTTTTYSLTKTTHTTGLTDVEGAKTVAKRIFELYDRDKNGIIDQVECVSMIHKAYESFDPSFTPTQADTSSYLKILDRNRDGKVTKEDIEQLCIRYLCPTSFQTSFVPQQEVRRAPRRLTAEAQQRLDIARRLFQQFDKDGNGYLEENEIQLLIQETYKKMGMNNIQITQEDVKAWLDMTDTNRDGKVTLEEYEAIILKSLEKAGFKIEQQSIVIA